MRAWFVAVLLCIYSIAFASMPPSVLKEKALKGHSGDFVVTQQGNHFSLLLLKEANDSILILEEITTPQSPPSGITWKEWVKRNAPGHTSWISFEIDLKESRLSSCYSFTKREWVYPEQGEHFFSKLLSLNFKKIEDKERKKVGPAPEKGEADRRKIWTPILMIDGKKADQSKFEVWKAKWPKDNTPLSEADIEIYLDMNRSDFPFPIWIEIIGAHYTFKIRAIDSGRELHSPMPQKRDPLQVMNNLPQS